MMTGGGARDDLPGHHCDQAADSRGDQKGPRRHVPVLLAEVLSHLKPVDFERYIDGTFGAGGYSRAILQAANCTLLGIDQDLTAISASDAMVREFAPRLTLSQGRFSRMRQIAGAASFLPVDGIVLDIGVSSMQLDERQRGFSFQTDGPLDMRMAANGPTAADVLANTQENDLADILFHLGEERRSRAIARAIIKQRETTPLTRTLELADLITKVLGRKPSDKKHPATRSFQALRIYVNDELGELSEGLNAAETLLRPGGRLVVVTFHSLEDRIVKRFFTSRTGKTPRTSRHQPQAMAPKFLPSFQFINRKPVSPNKTEITANPRARSARLRSAVRTSATCWGDDKALNDRDHPANERSRPWFPRLLRER